MKISPLYGAKFGLFLFWIMLGLWSISCSSPDDNSINSNSPGFFTTIYSDQVLDASLSFDLDSLIYFKDGNNEVPGTFVLGTNAQLSIPVELRARGVFRKNNCAIPPIRVQIKKAAATTNEWGPYRNYKLVTHCFDSLAADELLLKEYLIYKMYEALTDISLRAQLFRMQYNVNGQKLNHFAFMIENEREMSNRLGLHEMDIEKTKLKSIHFEHYKRFVLFQYMIGNTDWNLNAGHNTKYVLEDGSETPIIIPYDFDISGLVNAPYAIPYSTIPIQNVTERYFMYRGNKGDDFNKIIDVYRAKKEDLFSLISTSPHLSDFSKGEMLNYIGEFYDIIEQPNWKDHVFPAEN